MAAETYGAVTVWDSNLSEIARLDRSGAGWDAPTLAFLDGSREIATSPASHKYDTVTASIFDIATARVIHEIPGWLLTPVPEGLRVHNRTAALAVSPDQSILAVATGTPWDRRPIRFYSTNTWELTEEVLLAALGLDDRDDGVTHMAFAAKAPRLAVVAGWASTVLKVYDTERRNVILTLGQYPDDFGAIVSVAITAEGDYVAVALTPGNTRWFHPDGTLAPRGQGQIKHIRLPEDVRVYRVADGVLVASLVNSTGLQYDMKWRPHSHVLAFVAGDNAVHFWSPFQSREEGPRIPLGRGAVSLDFSPDGTKLAAGGDANLYIYSLDNP